MPTPLRVIVVDDHRVVRAGTRRILEDAEIDVVADLASAEDLLEQLNDFDPDVLLVDVRLPGKSGIELTEDLSASRPELKVLILSSYANVAYARAALAAGAVGYLVKTATDDELVSAVRSAASGATVLDPTISAELFLRSAGPPTPLTAREAEVVALVADGLANKAIARRLSVSPRTVDAHLGHLFTKLGLSSRAELVAWAARQGMLEP